VGIEHGVGAMLQGNAAPQGLVIQSWPESEMFRVLAGEPAMTVVPNLLAAGILAVLVSAAYLVWAVALVERRHSGLVLIVLAVVMLLVGAGFGPPLLGILVGLAATRINTPLTWWRNRLSSRSVQLLARLWPWCFAACVVAWLLLLPGTIVLDLVLESGDVGLVVPILTVSAFGLLLVTIVAGFGSDVTLQTASGTMHPWRE
jgi:hypothetical protein